MIRFFLWFIYIKLLVFYIELTHLAQKFLKKKKKKLTLDEARGAKLISTNLAQNFKNLDQVGHGV